jgi:hypothetical protein
VGAIAGESCEQVEATCLNVWMSLKTFSKPSILAKGRTKPIGREGIPKSEVLGKKLAEVELAEVELAEVELAEVELAEVEVAEVEVAEVEVAEVEVAEVEVAEVELARKKVNAPGLEPGTYGLKVRCSTD